MCAAASYGLIIMRPYTFRTSCHDIDIKTIWNYYTIPGLGTSPARSSA